MWRTAGDEPHRQRVPTDKTEGELQSLHNVEDDTLSWLKTEVNTALAE